MEKIDTKKVRTAIAGLQSAGQQESAQIVWDLLDAYLQMCVQAAPRPIVNSAADECTDPREENGCPWEDHEHVKAAKEIVKSLRGASAQDGLPKCAVAECVGGDACTAPAIGHLVQVKTGRSYPMCDTHGGNLNSPGYADWVQTFFGDEDSAEDVATHAEPEALACLAATLYVGAPELHGKCSRPAVGYLSNGESGVDTNACLNCGQSFADRYKRRGYTFTLYSDVDSE